eukprot:scpid46651/ scgid17510/ 
MTKQCAMDGVLQLAESGSHIIALDGQPLGIIGKASVCVGRLDGSTPVAMPDTEVEVLVVEDLSVVRADLLIGSNVVSRCRGLCLSYDDDGELERVRFGTDACAASAVHTKPVAKCQEAHPSRHVRVTQDGDNVTLCVDDGEVRWCHDTKRWVLKWVWKNGKAPQHPVGHGIGQYPRESLTAEQEQLFCRTRSDRRRVATARAYSGA